MNDREIYVYEFKLRNGKLFNVSGVDVVDACSRLEKYMFKISAPSCNIFKDILSIRRLGGTAEFIW